MQLHLLKSRVWRLRQPYRFIFAGGLIIAPSVNAAPRTLDLFAPTVDQTRPQAVFSAKLRSGVPPSVDLADHLKFKFPAVIPSWHLGSFAVQSAYLPTLAKCLGLWSCPGGSFHFWVSPVLLMRR